MKAKVPVYPDLLIENNRDGVTLSTYLRKHHEGKWYLQLVVQRDYNVRSAIEGFTRLCYLALTLGKVIPDLMDAYGCPLFEIDPIQTDEKERLLNLPNK